ncbi:MAG: DUF5615 family PIN-like protein [Acidobacteriota bacterium]
MPMKKTAPRERRTVGELGLSGADDYVARAAAIAGGRILVTLDRDFANVLRYPPGDTPGIPGAAVRPIIHR